MDCKNRSRIDKTMDITFLFSFKLSFSIICQNYCMFLRLLLLRYSLSFPASPLPHFSTSPSPFPLLSPSPSLSYSSFPSDSVCPSMLLSFFCSLSFAFIPNNSAFIYELLVDSAITWLDVNCSILHEAWNERKKVCIEDFALWMTVVHIQGDKCHLESQLLLPHKR